MSKCKEIKTDNNKVQCHCDKLCKGDRDLRAHQRLWKISDVPKLRELFNKDKIVGKILDRVR